MMYKWLIRPKLDLLNVKKSIEFELSFIRHIDTS